MLQPFPPDESGRERRQQYRVIERHTAPFLDPGDIAADRPVEEQCPQVSAR